MYRSAKKAVSNSKKAEYRHAAIELKLIGGPKKNRAVSLSDRLQRSVMKQHFLHMCAKQSGLAPVVSFKRKAVVLEGFGTALDTSETKRRQKAHDAAEPEHPDHPAPLALVPLDAGAGLPHCPDLDVTPEPSLGASDSVFLRVVMANPSKNKTIRTNIGAGGRLTAEDTLVSVHRSQAMSDGGVTMSMDPHTPGDAFYPIMILDLQQMADEFSLEVVKDSALMWKRDGLGWRIPGASDAGDLNEEEAANVIHECVATQAYHGTTSAGFLPPDNLARAVATMEQLGSVAPHPLEAGRWLLTRTALSGMRPTTRLSSPSKVFCVRSETLALEDRTDFELLQIMEGTGWQCLPWIPPSKRKKKDAPPPNGYALGDAKDWYASAASFSRHYVCALLSADRILCIEDGDLHDDDDGAPAPKIFHGCKDQYYKDLSGGKDPTSMLLAIGDICDLDDPGGGGSEEADAHAVAEAEVDITMEDLSEALALEDCAGEESERPETPRTGPASAPSTPGIWFAGVNAAAGS